MNISIQIEKEAQHPKAEACRKKELPSSKKKSGNWLQFPDKLHYSKKRILWA